MSAELDVVGLGNAIVDVVARVEEDFLLKEGVAKGTMRLISTEEAETLYEKLGQTIETSGGSASNTISGLASLGAKAGFIGTVADDALGKTFTHDLKGVGVEAALGHTPNGTPTARSLILVTPDGERTMNTYLGAAQDLTPAQVDEDLVSKAKITFLEGYLWDPENAKAAFRKAADLAHKAGRKVALSLSDVFCIDRHRDEFLALLKNGDVDIVFANEAEAHALFETANTQAAFNAFKSLGILSFITRSEKGSVVIWGDETHFVPAYKVEKVVDATGAGDLFAAGALYGLTHNLPLPVAAQLGGLCAAEVISHIGARPQTSLKALAQEYGFRVK